MVEDSESCTVMRDQGLEGSQATGPDASTIDAVIATSCLRPGRGGLGTITGRDGDATRAPSEGEHGVQGRQPARSTRVGRRGGMGVGRWVKTAEQKRGSNRGRAARKWGSDIVVPPADF